MQSTQELSIIIPHRDQNEQLNACLSALQNQINTKGIRYEIIIVDDGSSKTVELPSDDSRIKIHQTQGHSNPYVCRNIGIRLAQYEHLAFLDASCVPDAGWMYYGLTAMSKSDIVAGTFDVAHSSDDLYSMAYKLMYLHNQEHIAQGGAVPAGNFFTRKAVFEKIGYFSEISRSGGDTEWSMRAKKSNISIGISPLAKVYYPGKNKLNFMNDVIRYGRGARVQWLHQKGRWHKTLVAMSYFINIPKSRIEARAHKLSIELSKSQMIKIHKIIGRARRLFAQAMLGRR